MKAHSTPHSIQLAVAQLVVTEAFYAGILELPVRRSFTSKGAPDHLVIEMEGMTIIFVEETDVIKAHPILEPRFSMFPRGIGITLHFEVTEIEDIRDAIMEEGLEVLYPLDIKPYGVKEMWCFDPDGYLIVLDEALPPQKKAGQ
ncbi:MAG: glyoxalase [Geobacteraceae bacterium GWC2_53_11]|nr:MAG: glyoxalase [Geobacteraceae bacterium GWC2_53_11]